MGRPLNEAVASQQKVIEGLQAHVASLGQALSINNLVLDYVVKIADLGNDAQAIRTQAALAFRRQADVENPAQPVPNPPSKPATETTEQAATPEAYDNPLVPGQTPGSVQHLPADATGTVMDPGTTLPTAPYTNLTDVTAPVAGTETHVPNDQTRTEVDVRVGDPMNPQRAFPWGISPDAQGSQAAASRQNRTMASIHLARLRIQAGTAQGDDMAVAGQIEANASLSDQAIMTEIGTLRGVIAATQQRTASQRPAGAVPRPAAPVTRTMPSLVGDPAQPQQHTASAQGVDQDMEDSDLFIN